MSTPSALPIQGVLQPYAWGGTDYLARFLHRPNPAGEPQAEYWMGAHAKGPAELIGHDRTLDNYVAADPEGVLGTAVARRFDDRLPFLFKVLDVKDMLSIQVHPTKDAAEKGFAAEEANGPERTAPNRNYRDDNHKPELGVALTDFYLLHGFKDSAAIEISLNTVPGWSELLPALRSDGVAGLYGHVMALGQADLNELLQPLVDSLGPESDYSRDQPEFWASRAVQQYSEGGRHDRGLFSIYWFNIVHLRPGEGIFQDAGIPHAYLEGVCLELMANSDNVLRGGLTPKHIDVPELLDKTSFDPVSPAIITPDRADRAAAARPNDEAGTASTWHRYATPAPDFQLYETQANPGGTIEVDTAGGPAILLLLMGSARCTDEDWGMDEEQRTVFVPAGRAFTLRAGERGVVIYRAGVGES